MNIRQKLSSDMTIRKRLAVSNVLMIAVPVIITALIGALCLCLIWLSVRYGEGLGFDDSKDFYKASRSISKIAERYLMDGDPGTRTAALAEISRLLDKNAMALSVDSPSGNIYRYGHIGPSDDRLLASVAVLGGQGFVSDGSRELYVRQSEIDGKSYRIAVFASPYELSYKTLKAAVAFSAVLLLFGIFFSIYITNRFLTRFVFRKIERPLDILSDGVRQIRDGNLEHRIEYGSNDEFAPVCADFNEMAERLKASEERMKRHEQSRKELLAGISHDLRSPLTSIRAYVEGLSDGVAKTPEARARYLDIIKNKTEEIDRMLSKIFIFSKMELGEYPENPELLRLDDEISQLVRAVGEEYAEKGLVVTAGELAPAAVYADAVQLRRVLTNIIENSLKYKTKEVGTLTISLSRKDGECRLSLRDDGPGVPEEALPRLFEVFFRGDPSRQHPDRGSGLGLAIASNAVRRMNGTIIARNAENGGLETVISLPAAEEHDG